MAQPGQASIGSAFDQRPAISALPDFYGLCFDTTLKQQGKTGGHRLNGSERIKMAAGEWYTCLDPELEALRILARDAVFTTACRPGNVATSDLP
jgi:hypothetical protein